MPTSVDSLLIIALVLTPGFIFTLIVTRTVANLIVSELRFLLTIVSMGIVIHGLLFPWTVRIASFYTRHALLDHRWQLYAWGVITILVTPIALGLLVSWFSRWRPIDAALEHIGFSYIDRLPSAWEFITLQRQSAYVRVHLTDGRGKIGGVYSQRSFASIEPAHGDLFIQEVWRSLRERMSRRSSEKPAPAREKRPATFQPPSLALEPERKGIQPKTELKPYPPRPTPPAPPKDEGASG
jgi:hypothetical protein